MPKCHEPSPSAASFGRENRRVPVEPPRWPEHCAASSRAPAIRYRRRSYHPTRFCPSGNESEGNPLTAITCSSALMEPTQRFSHIVYGFVIGVYGEERGDEYLAIHGLNRD